MIDVVSFTIFFFGWIILFGILYRITGMGIGRGSYPTLQNPAVYFIYAYRNSVGDDSNPRYAFWSQYLNDGASGKTGV